MKQLETTIDSLANYSKHLADDTFAIFLFHGVVREQKWRIRNYNRKHIDVARFVEILADLLTIGQPVSMEDVVRACRGQTDLPPRAFAITFDDGFENNFSVAAPILRRLAIPATFYVTGEFIENQTMVWADKIEYWFERLDEFELHMPYPGMSGRFRTDAEKISLLRKIRMLVKGTPSIDPYEFAAQVCRQIATGPIVPDRDLDSKMTWQQISQLAEHDDFIVGGHGMSHRILEYLPDRDLHYEIYNSIAMVQKYSRGNVRHFSYPDGVTGCYSQRVIDILKSNGIVCSPSADHGVNRVGDDPFHLKRIMAE